jgi:hypothetical protein
MRIALMIALASMTAICHAAPTVFWASDPVGPDDTVMVMGDGFGENPQVSIARLADGKADAPGAALAWPGGGVEAEVLQPSEQSVKFIVPPAMQPGAYVFRVTGPDGDSASVRLNCPTPYWSQGDAGVAASPGGWVRVFGRCVGSDDAEATVALRSVAGARVVWLKVTEADIWSVTATVPADIAEGEYRVFVHNGHGGPAAWGEARSITVATPEQWPQAVYDVTDFGASRQAKVIDGEAIRAALAAAEKAGGGIVYLPRGQYQVTGTLHIPRRTVLRGEGTQLVALLWPDTEESYTLIEGTNRFGIEDLTIYASNYAHCIAAEVGQPDSGDTFLRRVRVRADMYRGHLKFEEIDARFRAHKQLSSGGGDTVRMGGRNVEITDCDLYGSGRSLYLLRVRGARITGNTFYNGRWGWYCFDGSDGLIFEDNSIIGADLMSTGGGINCYSSAYSQNVYYAHNQLRLMHGWDREAMTSDAGYGAWFGVASEVGPDTLALGGDDPTWNRKSDWTGAGVFVLGGRGMGQYRLIKEYDGRSVTLDRPWDVMPDADSPITITMMQRQYLFIGNEFEDVGIALQYYGTSIDHVAADNRVTRGGGFYNSGRWYRHFQPSWYCQFMGNEILEGNSYRYGPNNATVSGTSFIGTWGLQAQGGQSPLALGGVHRRNHLHNNAELRFIGVSAEHPGLRDVVAEHNIIENSDQGIYVDDGCVGVLLRDNVFHNVDHELVNERELALEREKQRTALVDQPEPIVHYSFDDLPGVNVPDLSGRGHLGIPTGAIKYEQSLSGQAPRFDGTAYYVVAGGEALEFERITISAWVLPDTVQGRWGVVAKRAHGGVCPYVVAIRNGGVTFEGTDANGKWSYNITTKPVLTEGHWHHIAAVCEEGVGVKTYCDGELVGEKATPERLVSTGNTLTVGYENWGGLEQKPGVSGNFQGLIDEVSIWSRLLSDDEIRAEYEKLREAAAADVERREEEQAALENLRERWATEVILPGGVDWQLQRADDFEAGLDPVWKTLRGKWTVEGGTLRCSEVSFLALDQPMALPVRIEYDARSAHPGDLTAFWGTEKAAYNDGYFIGFASNGNTGNKLLRSGQQVAGNDGPVATPGAWHHVIAQIIGGTVQLIVDGHPALEYTDPRPLAGKRLPGLIAWGEGEFDNVRVYGG